MELCFEDCNFVFLKQKIVTNLKIRAPTRFPKPASIFQMLSSNVPSSVHPKIQIESKEDVLFLKKELESAGRMALADILASSGLTGQDVLESTLQKRVHQVCF